MSSALFRLGKWSYHHRRLVAGAWVMVIVVLAVLAVSFKQPTNNSLTIPGTQSQDAINLLNQKFPGTGGAQAQVVFSVGPSETLTSPSHRQAIEA
ncbi:MAG TPA: hypothetical protein VEJ84_23830, partial [Acidimicrobiales bacterium]|nr:hypothetical protein [Acidimicrobiales bacterium]